MEKGYDEDVFLESKASKLEKGRTAERSLQDKGKEDGKLCDAAEYSETQLQTGEFKSGPFTAV